MSTTEKRNFSVVGKSVPRVDAGAKVRGRAMFTDDLSLPNMVYGRIKPATIAHGIIKKIDYAKALELPGVLGVITGKDWPVPFVVNDHMPSEYPLTPEKVCYYGEGVAAVAATSEAVAEDALELIEVTYEELPVLLDPQEAMKQDDVRIHDFAENNIHVTGEQHFGDVDKALEDCHLVVENRYKTPGLYGAFLEPQSGLADYDTDNDKLTLWTCNQLSTYCQMTVARTLQMRPDKVRVIFPCIGGGFGGKTEITPAALVACILSKKLGRPVKVTYDRQESMWQLKGRHGADMVVKMGFNKDGTIAACDFDTTLDGGAHSSWGLVVLWFSAALLQGPYIISNIRFQGRRVYTNKGTAGAQRGLGGVQVRLAVECLLDEAAEKLGIDAFKLRHINAVESGHQTPSAVTVRHSEYKKCLESVVERSDYLEKRGKLPFGRGIGLAGGHYSTGGAFLLYPSFRPHSTANIRVDTEAGLTVSVGATDIGQGSTTVLAQMAAEIFGLPHTDVNMVCMDTTLAPMDNGTYDSRLTYGAGHAVKNAAIDARDKLLKVVAIGMGVRDFHLECGNGHIYSIYNPKKKIGFYEAVDRYQNSVGTLWGTGDYTPPQPKGNYQGNLIGPSPAFGFTAQIAEVDIDLDTGKVRIPRFWEASDCGQAINPMSVEGQVEGGLSMSIGHALYEEVQYGEDGRMLNSNLADYKIPSTMDMPELDTDIVDSYDPTSSFGNKEIGEGPATAGGPAVLNAIYDAIGVRITETPVTPEKILRALGKI